MSDSDVDKIKTMGPRLSDTDAEALIAGQIVAGVPQGLSDMLSMMREQVTTGPAVPLSGAVSGFVEESVASVTPIKRTPPTPALSRKRSLAKKAAAGFAIVPAKILIGATMAAAAVGGAQVLGVVDVPILPGPAASVVSSVPVETLSPRTSDGSTVPAAKTVKSESGSTQTARTGTAASGSTETARGNASVSVPPTGTVQPKADVPVVISPPTVPSQSAVDGDPGCEFGQETSERRRGESNDDAPTRRPDNGASPKAPSVDPCDRSAPEVAPGSAPLDPPSSPPADRGRDEGAPPAVPGKNEEKSRGVSETPSARNETGNSADRDDGAPSNSPPGSDQRSSAGQADAGRNSAANPEPPKNSGRGRTPSGG